MLNGSTTRKALNNLSKFFSRGDSVTSPRSPAYLHMSVRFWLETALKPRIVSPRCLSKYWFFIWIIVQRNQSTCSPTIRVFWICLKLCSTFCDRSDSRGPTSPRFIASIWNQSPFSHTTTTILATVHGIPSDILPLKAMAFDETDQTFQF